MNLENIDPEKSEDDDRLFCAGAVAAQLLVGWKVGYRMKARIRPNDPVDPSGIMRWRVDGPTYHPDAPLAVTCAGLHGGQIAVHVGRGEELEVEVQEEEDDAEDEDDAEEEWVIAYSKFIRNGGADPQDHSRKEIIKTGWRAHCILHEFRSLHLRLTQRIYDGETLDTDDVRRELDSMQDGM